MSEWALVYIYIEKIKLIDQPYCKRFVTPLCYLSWASSSGTALRPSLQQSERSDRAEIASSLSQPITFHSTAQSRQYATHTHTHSLTRRQRAGREGEAWSIYIFSSKACRSTGVRFLVVALCFRHVVGTVAVNKHCSASDAELL